MRIESSVTSVSWIPSEAVTGRRAEGHVRDRRHPLRRPAARRRSTTSRSCARPGAFRFANHLAAWVEIEDGRIVDAGYSGGGLMGPTTVRLAKLRDHVRAGPAPRHPARARDRPTPRSRFVQTTGGRTGLPAPRRVKHPPFVQFKAPTVWTTLALTIRADGTSDFEVLGASKFPRHWVYDDDGQARGQGRARRLQGLVPRRVRQAHAVGRPDSKALVTAVETALERQLSTHDHARATPSPRSARSRRASASSSRASRARDLFLAARRRARRCSIDGEPVAEVGPGRDPRRARRARRRRSAPRPVGRRPTCRVAVAPADQIDRDALLSSRGHRREEHRLDGRAAVRADGDGRP